MRKIAVIMCGGKGSRLWPISIDKTPKQFIKLVNDKTLLENTLERIPKDYERIFLSNIKYESELEKYILPSDTVIYEPIMKNTGQAISAVIMHLTNKYGNEDMKILVVPSDHVTDELYFNTKITEAMDILDINNIVIFGISPSYPTESYGYIKTTNNKLDYFIEKPNMDISQKLINDGCLWNSGIFTFKKSYIHHLLNLYNKDCNKCMLSITNAIVKDNNIYLSSDYNDTTSISFDYLIMEKIRDCHVLKYDGFWSDVGNWKSLESLFDYNEHNNTIIGDNVKCIDTTNTFIHNTENLNVKLIGVNNLIIVKSNNNILIMDKDSHNKISH